MDTATSERVAQNAEKQFLERSRALSSDYRILIDWISFTIDIDWQGATQAWMYDRKLTEQLEGKLGWLMDAIAEHSPSWELSSGRAPYKHSWRSETGIAIYWSGKVGHCLMEVTGRGCEFLRTIGVLHSLVSLMRERITRIDLAVDLKTTTVPTVFTENGLSGRFKSTGVVKSDTGETVYIGSRKSERYCRVYRYAPPHPRSSYLRTEFVFRKQNAKLFAASAIESNWNYTALALGAGAVYGFEHEDWNLKGDEIPLTSYTPERREGKTVMWLVSQVAPAFKRLVADGVIEDPEQFIREFFLDA